MRDTDQIVAESVMGRPISTITGKPIQTSREKAEQVKPIIDMILSMAPGIGDARDIGEAISGKDIFGQPLGGFDRILSAVLAALPLIGGGMMRMVKGDLKPMKSASKVAKGEDIIELTPEMEIKKAKRIQASLSKVNWKKTDSDIWEALGQMDEWGRYRREGYIVRGYQKPQGSGYHLYKDDKYVKTFKNLEEAQKAFK